MRLLPLAVATALVAATAPADAQEFQNQSYVTAAAGACQSALPVFDTLLRKRPLAVQNEGSTTTFVTCAVSNPMNQYGSPLRMNGQRATLINLSDTDVWVTCTQVVNLWGNEQSYHVKSGHISASSYTTLFFTDGSSTTSAISCALPPGVGIRTIEHSEWNGIWMGSGVPMPSMP